MCQLVSYLFKCLGTGQEITNAVNPSINLLFSVSLNYIKKTPDFNFQMTTSLTNKDYRSMYTKM